MSTVHRLGFVIGFWRLGRNCWQALVAMVCLAGCMGSGGGGGGATAGPQVAISGRVTFSSPELRSTGGLDLDNADTAGRRKPIRGAVIEVRNQAGAVVSRGNTATDGTYALTAPANSTVSIVVKAALGSPTAPDVQVVDNGGITSVGTSTYALALSNVAVGAVALTGVDFTATTGWSVGSQSYTGTRAAAPFAILDVVFQAQTLVRSEDPTATFPALTLNWSVSNLPSGGSIGTTFYSPGQVAIFVLGAEDVDTDEFDTHVIAHEWTHYFEDQFGRTDSLGGSHSIPDLLDPTVAFGEGLANAMSGMIAVDDLGDPDPLYIDTNGDAQATTGLLMDLEAGRAGNVNGFWSEVSVQEIIWDLFDATNDAGQSDALSLGFGPIYQVLTNGQRTTRAFTTLHTFLAKLKDADPASALAIDARALAEGITVSEEFQATGGGSSLYTPITVGLTTTTDVNGFSPLRTLSTNGAISAGDPGNKLFNRSFFVTTIPGTGRMSITVTPTTLNRAMVLFFPDIAGSPSDQTGATDSPLTIQVTGTPGAVQCFAVGSVIGASQFTLTTVQVAKTGIN